MNSNNYNCLIKLADTLPEFSTVAKELTKLSPEVALNAIQQNPQMLSGADRAGLTRLLTELPARSSDVITKLTQLAPNSPDSRNIAYSHIPDKAVMRDPGYRTAPEPVKASFSPLALREFEKLSPTARLNVLNREFNNGRLDSLSSLSSTAANNVIHNEFPALRPSDWNRDYARERWLPEHSFPLANSPINPATGGYRITAEPEGNFTGPLPIDHSMRQGPLPLAPSSSDPTLSPFTLRDARAQASAVQDALAINEANKRKVALNFDALFKDVHDVNLLRAAAGLPAYQPNAFDVYAPYASNRLDYAEALNRALNDTAMSTITTEAARRGKSYNPAEINYMQRNMLPQNAQLRGLREQLPFIDPIMREFGGGAPYKNTFNANNYQLHRSL